MSDEKPRHEAATRRVVYQIPGMEAVPVRRDVAYRTTDAGALTLDLYYPLDWRSGDRSPAVVFVAGYPDPGLRAVLGCKFKEMGAYLSWGQLVAASGLVAVTYENADPAADIHRVLQYLRDNAGPLGLDADRIGLWAGSGNVPNALGVLMAQPRDHVQCAALCYGYLLDLDGSTGVAQAAATWHFANPCAGKTVDDLPANVALLIARAGRDEYAGINESIDRFLAGALRRNLPVTLVNHAAGPHAFELFDDSETSREIVRQILGFLRFHLLARGPYASQ